MGWHELFVLTWKIAIKDIGWKYLKDYDNNFLYTCEFRRQEGGALKESDPTHPPLYTHVACTLLKIYPIYRTRMANTALKCPLIILITARSFCSYNNILIIIQHPWTILTENSAS